MRANSVDIDEVAHEDSVDIGEVANEGKQCRYR